MKLDILAEKRYNILALRRTNNNYVLLLLCYVLPIQFEEWVYNPWIRSYFVHKV